MAKAFRLALMTTKVTTKTGPRYKVERWDREIRAWVPWKGVLQLPQFGMYGSYQLHEKNKGVYFKRLTQFNRVQWDIRIPEGISVWTAQDGLLHDYVLPWEHVDEVVRVLALFGIERARMIENPGTVRDMGVKPMSGIRGRQEYQNCFISDVEPLLEVDDNAGTAEEKSNPVLRYRLPTFVIDYDIVQPDPEYPEGGETRWVRQVHVWRETANGEKISPRALVKALQSLVLSSSMLPWELDLYRKGYRSKK